ncbi:hypothetical protein K9M16_02595 [Candidatus Babeliales bacterium]|nr:hypothetical protein [Candidatus Babeliales bacterium]
MIFNSKKFKYSILVFCFSVFFVNQLFGYDPKTVYYTEHKWEFLEKKFIDECKDTTQFSGFKKFCYFQLAALSIGSFLYPLIKDGCLEEITIVVNALFHPIFQEKSNSINRVTRYIFSLFIINTIAFLLFEFASNKPTDIQTLKLFLQSYPAISKDFLPKELHSTFDALHDLWLKEGDACLKKEGCEIINLIREKIKYQINPNKYNQKTKKGFISEIFAKSAGQTVRHYVKHSI